MRHCRSLPALLLAFALLAGACSDDGADGSGADPSPSAGEAEEPTATSVDDPPNDVLEATVTVDASTVSPIAATITIESPEPVTAQITATAGDHEVSTPRTTASASDHVLPLVGMRQDLTYEIAVNLTSGEGVELDPIIDSFTTGTIDDNIPEFEITNTDPARRSPGITIVETNTVRAALPGDFGGNAIVGLDEDDEIVWYYNSPRFNGSVQQTPAGEVAAQNDPFGMTVHAVTGEQRRYYPDLEGDDVARIEGGVELIPYHADWVPLGTVHHDLQWQPDGTAFALSRTVHEIPVERQQELCPGDAFEWGVISDVIMHMSADGTVIRTWDLWDIASFDDLPGNFLCRTQGLGISETERDWSHANALWFDETRDAILVSSRHTDQIIALTMTDETGPQTGVRWIIGADGTVPYTGESFHHTHGVKTAANGDILLYDNGNFRPGTLSAGGTGPDYSRAVRIQVDDATDDPSTWTATQVWDHRMIDPVTGEPIYAPFISDTDELANGNILVTHGGAVVDPADFLDSHVHIVEIDPVEIDPVEIDPVEIDPVEIDPVEIDPVEIDPVETDTGDDMGGDIVWELRAEGDGGESTYRADRWESLYFGPLWATD